MSKKTWIYGLECLLRMTLINENKSIMNLFQNVMNEARTDWSNHQLLCPHAELIL